MKKWFFLGFALLALVCLGVAGLVLPWHSWTTSPSAVIEDSLNKANAGRYEEATQNFNAVTREDAAKDPEKYKEMWDLITRNRSITKVNIVKVDRGWDDAHVTVEIHYQDGWVLVVEDHCFMQDGAWRHDAGNILTAVMAEAERRAKEAAKQQPVAELPKLAAEYTPAEKTGIALRLPAGCQWNNKWGAFEQPDLHCAVMVRQYAGVPLESLVKAAPYHFKLPGPELAAEEDIKLGKVPGKLWTFATTDPKNVSWSVRILIAGNGVESIVLIGQCPKQDALLEALTRECLLTAQWEPHLDPDLPNKVPFTVDPTVGLSLKQFMGTPAGLTFRAPDSQLASAPQAPMLTCMPWRFPMPVTDRLQAYQSVLPFLVAPSKSEGAYFKPIVVNGLDGFEAVATAFDERHKLQLFRYTVLLFRTNTEGFVISGTVALEDRERYEPQFREMAHSFLVRRRVVSR
jgi:hypothetical protein